MSDASRAVFLSYASQDAEAVARLATALRAAGVEVWFDQNELVGGDAWDAKIRRQIKECALFVPVISANTQARGEGYFRLEWKLAVDRSHLMAHDQPFLLPVVIDATSDATARVPDEFRAVQWTRLSSDQSPTAVCMRVKALLDRSDLGTVNRADRDTGRTTDKSPPGGRALPGRGIRPILAVLMVAVVGVGVVTNVRWEWLGTTLAWRQRTAETVPSQDRPNAPQPAIAPRSVAVLPFENVSGLPENGYFSEGIADELLTTLQKIPGLRVAARASAWSFKGTRATVEEVGEKLGMAHIVEGSVQKIGNQVKITARLSRSATNEQLWSQSYGPLELTDVFAIQSQIAQTIVAELRGKLTGTGAGVSSEIRTEVQAAQRGGTTHPQAHQLYLQGLFFLNQHTVPAAIRASALLRQAVDLDPQFARAWAALSRSGWIRGGFGETAQDLAEGFKLAREAADRALQLQPDLAAAHLARADLLSSHDLDWPGAAAAIQHAMKLEPHNPTVLDQAARLASAGGQIERSLELGEQAVALDPVNPILRAQLGYSLLCARRFDAATAEFKRVIELSPSATWGHAGVSMVLTAQNRFAEAAAEAEKETTGWSRLCTLAIAEWGHGQRSQSDTALRELIATFSDVAAVQIAWVYAYRGENDQAFTWLERAYRQRDGGLNWTKANPLLEKLHSDSRWHAFLKRIRLDQDHVK